MLRAARVARKSSTYTQVARGDVTQTNLLVTLKPEEKDGLVSEQEDLRENFWQILPMIVTVGCAAFLQGHFQASINCSTLYADAVLHPGPHESDSNWQWKLGAMNAMPFFIAAIVGAPSALLFNHWMGRRGAITVAAFMILASSLGSAWCSTWWQLMCARIVGGVGQYSYPFHTWKRWYPCFFLTVSRHGYEGCISSYPGKRDRICSVERVVRPDVATLVSHHTSPLRFPLIPIWNSAELDQLTLGLLSASLSVRCSTWQSQSGTTHLTCHRHKANSMPSSKSWERPSSRL